MSKILGLSKENKSVSPFVNGNDWFEAVDWRNQFLMKSCPPDRSLLEQERNCTLCRPDFKNQYFLFGAAGTSADFSIHDGTYLVMHNRVLKSEDWGNLRFAERNSTDMYLHASPGGLVLLILS